MFFKSSTQPLCRYCGKPIPKWTERVYFGCSAHEVEHSRGRAERPANKTEAQRYVNGEIVSVEYSDVAREPDGRRIEVPRYVRAAGVWDRETYIDEFFCKGEHAKDFGAACARNGTLSMPAYRQALERQRG